MKNFLTLIAFAVFSFSTVNAKTTIKINAAGDTYYATDNDKSVGLDERQLANTNIFKDRFGTNNVLLNASATSDFWRANVAIATYGDPMMPEEANIGLKLFDNLWATGGLYAIWDMDYTFNNWFTGNSLTDLYAMSNGPFMAWGLEYGFNDDVTLGVGLMNSGVWGPYELYGFNGDNNRSKTFYTKLDWENLFNDWSLVAFCIYGNEADWGFKHHLNIMQIHLGLRGTIVENLEAQINGKFVSVTPDVDSVDALNGITLQALLRYRFNEKFAAGCRFSFNNQGVYTYHPNIPWLHNGKSEYSWSGIDLGLVAEYNPTPFTYLRLEGGMVSLSADSDIEDNFSKIFYNGDKYVSSRLGVALSMGFRFNLYETVK